MPEKLTADYLDILESTGSLTPQLLGQVLYPGEKVMTIKEFIAKNAEEKREPSSLSALAKAMGVSRQTVYNWMHAKYSPSFGHVLALVQLSDGRVHYPADTNVTDMQVHAMFKVAKQFYADWGDLASALLAPGDDDV